MSLAKSIEKMHQLAQSQFKKDLTSEEITKFKEWLPTIYVESANAIDDSKEWQVGEVFLHPDGKRYLVSTSKYSNLIKDDED